MSSTPFILGAAAALIAGPTLLNPGADVETRVETCCCAVSQPPEERSKPAAQPPKDPATPAKPAAAKLDPSHPSVTGTVAVARGWSLAKFDPTRVVVFLG